VWSARHVLCDGCRALRGIARCGYGICEIWGAFLASVKRARDVELPRSLCAMILGYISSLLYELATTASL
jgi:hypothetical protein